MFESENEIETEVKGRGSLERQSSQWTNKETYRVREKQWMRQKRKRSVTQNFSEKGIDTQGCSDEKDTGVTGQLFQNQDAEGLLLTPEYMSSPYL